MTVRSRFVLGLASISVTLLVPFLMALSELDSFESTLDRVQGVEFRASLQLGRVRDAVDRIAVLERQLAFADRPSTYADSMGAAFDNLRALTDSLRTSIPRRASRLDSTVTNLGHYVREYRRVPPLQTSRAQVIADSIYKNHLRPALSSIQAELPALEVALDSNIFGHIGAVLASSAKAQQAGILGLIAATLLAGAIGVWLTRSLSGPVHDFETAMRAVADGDLSYALRTEKSAPTEFARLARSYRSMVQQLAELDKLKAEFVSVASHELKTPINVIIGYAQLLDEGAYGELNPQQREVCQILESQSHSLARLVNQLLDVSRFEAGGGRLETRPIKLEKFVSDLEESFAVLSMQRGIEFRTVLGETLPAEVEWDEDRINEVMGNLLSNAFKFTQGGGSVELVLNAFDDSIRIDVRDTGIGIPQDQLPRIFDKFYQVERQLGVAPSGSGLGLAIAKEIVEAHQGEITVESAMGVGTTFTLLLPRIAKGGRHVTSRRRTPAYEVGVGT